MGGWGGIGSPRFCPRFNRTTQEKGKPEPEPTLLVKWLYSQGLATRIRPAPCPSPSVVGRTSIPSDSSGRMAPPPSAGVLSAAASGGGIWVCLLRLGAGRHRKAVVLLMLMLMSRSTSRTGVPLPLRWLLLLGWWNNSIAGWISAAVGVGHHHTSRGTDVLARKRPSYGFGSGVWVWVSPSIACIHQIDRKPGRVGKGGAAALRAVCLLAASPEKNTRFFNGRAVVAPLFFFSVDTHTHTNGAPPPPASPRVRSRTRPIVHLSNETGAARAGGSEWIVFLDRRPLLSDTQRGERHHTHTHAAPPPPIAHKHQRRTQPLATPPLAAARPRHDDKVRAIVCPSRPSARRVQKLRTSRRLGPFPPHTTHTHTSTFQVLHPRRRGRRPPPQHLPPPWSVAAAAPAHAAGRAAGQCCGA